MPDACADGLASIPRKLWREGSATTMMNRLYMRASGVESRLKVAEDVFKDVLLDVRTSHTHTPSHTTLIVTLACCVHRWRVS